MTAPKQRNPAARAAFAICLALLGVAAAGLMPLPRLVAATRQAVGQQRPRALGEVPPGVYREQDVTDRPEYVGGPRPEYPESLRAAAVDGRVVIEFIVDTTGHVEPRSVLIVSTTDRAFEEPTRQAVLGSRFKAGRVQGRAVRVLVRQPINYQVSK